MNKKLTEAEFYKAIHSPPSEREKAPDVTTFELLKLGHEKEYRHMQNKSLAIRREECVRQGDVQGAEQSTLAIQAFTDEIERIEHKEMYIEILLGRRDTYILGSHIPDAIPRTCEPSMVGHIYRAIIKRLGELDYHENNRLAQAVGVYRGARMNDKIHRLGYAKLLDETPRNEALIEAAQKIGQRLVEEEKTAKLNLWCGLLAQKKWKLSQYEIIRALPILSVEWQERLKKAHRGAWS